MVSRGNLSGQTDYETADENASKGDFTSGEANRHGDGDGQPEGRLNSIIVSIL